MAAIWFQPVKQGREKLLVVENNWKLVGFGQVVLELSWSGVTALESPTALGVHLKRREWRVSSSLSAGRQLGASNELCSFAARLMETSGDLSHSFSFCVCVSCPLFPSLQHPNGYLWDLIPGTSEAWQSSLSPLPTTSPKLLVLFFDSVKSSLTNL